MEFARDAAGNALVDGNRGIDVCQAYLLMAVYPVPKKKWAEDRSWLLMGVAIRCVQILSYPFILGSEMVYFQYGVGTRAQSTSA